MQILAKAVTAIALTLVLGAAPVLADAPVEDGAVVTINTLGTTPEYPVLTRGQVVLINAQRFVVTREPLPAAKVAEAPPAPQASEVDRPTAPRAGAVWVEAHWIYGPTGFSWVAGRYVAPRAGHVFVPPRWASLDGQHFFFTGFYVPYGVYVRSHFNRYYYSGMPNNQSRRTQGPYWPIGAPTRANSALTSAHARDPYWPIGVRR
ncbi:MAG: hypothetical protein ACERNK_12700 [Deltaproteobacteria bacterium]